MSPYRSRVYYLLRKSHRSVGVFLSVFLVLLCVTGVLLNHTNELNLESRFVPSVIAARYYPSNGSVKGKLHLEEYYFELGGRLYANDAEIAHCDALDGLVDIREQRIILCDGELIILTLDNQIVERLDSSVGVPDDISKIAGEKGRLVLMGKTQNYEFNLETLALIPFPDSIEADSLNVKIPSELILNKSITWQQLVLDVHSGIVLGSMGKWFLDLVALCLCGMAVSGISMWLKRH